MAAPSVGFRLPARLEPPALRALVHDALFERVHSSTLIYNTCWEDPRLDRQMLRLNQESRVVMITSAGCNALDYLLDDPAEIHAVDVNPRQNALLQLKLALFEHGDHAELFRVLGEGRRPVSRTSCVPSPLSTTPPAPSGNPSTLTSNPAASAPASTTAAPPAESLGSSSKRSPASVPMSAPSSRT